jgi:hypothetical protein
VPDTQRTTPADPAVPPAAATDDEMCMATDEHEGRFYTCLADKGHPAGTVHVAWGTHPRFPVHTWPQAETSRQEGGLASDAGALLPGDSPSAERVAGDNAQADNIDLRVSVHCTPKTWRGGAHHAACTGFIEPAVDRPCHCSCHQVADVRPDPTIEVRGGLSGRDEITPATASGRNYACPDCGTTASYPAHDVSCHRYYVAKLWGSHQAERAREAVAAVKAARDAWLAVPATSDAGHDDAREQARHALTDARHEAADALRWLLEELDTQAGAA